VSLVHTGIRHPKSVMKNVIPVVMAGVIGIYGLIVGVILAQSITKPTNDRQNMYSIYTAMAHVSDAGSCRLLKCYCFAGNLTFEISVCSRSLLWRLWIGGGRLHRNCWRLRCSSSWLPCVSHYLVSHQCPRGGRIFVHTRNRG
jgi:ATP synthase proteolipid subunit